MDENYWPAKDRLRAARLNAGDSQAGLAKRSGVNLRMIQFYEQGYKELNKASAITIWRLANALGCKMEDLLDLEGEE